MHKMTIFVCAVLATAALPATTDAAPLSRTMAVPGTIVVTAPFCGATYPDALATVEFVNAAPVAANLKNVGTGGLVDVNIVGTLVVSSAVACGFVIVDAPLTTATMTVSCTGGFIFPFATLTATASFSNLPGSVQFTSEPFIVTGVDGQCRSYGGGDARILPTGAIRSLEVIIPDVPIEDSTTVAACFGVVGVRLVQAPNRELLLPGARLGACDVIDPPCDAYDARPEIFASCGLHSTFGGPNDCCRRAMEPQSAPPINIACLQSARLQIDVDGNGAYDIDEGDLVTVTPGPCPP